MGERSGAPSGFSPALIVISKPPIAVHLPHPDVSDNRDTPHYIWHHNEAYLKIDRRMVYLGRAVYAEGEVLAVLVQSKRNKHAALKLMRKQQRKYAVVPD